MIQDNLQEVRVYDEQDRFLCTAAQVASLSYFAKKEEVAAAMKEQRKYERTVKEWKEQNVKQAQNELELLMWEAEQNQEEGGEQPNAKIIELKQAAGKTAGAGCWRRAGRINRLHGRSQTAA